MKIAVVGAGYSGLACAWHLLHSPMRPRGLRVTLFDSVGIGGGASGLAAGLLHCYVGLHAKKNWRGEEGMRATCCLIEHAAEALGQPVAQAKGILRVATLEEQEKNYRRCAEENDDVEWWEPSRCLEAVPSLSSFRGGVYIVSGRTVESNAYLQGLWKSCQLQGAELSCLSVERLAQLKGFDRIVVAAGYGFQDIEELADLPLTMVKGQLLELAWPESIAPLPFPVNSRAYVVMGADNRRCLAGATFEKEFESSLPDLEIARQEIISKLEFLPHLQHTHIFECRSSIRVSTKNHLPFIKQVNPRTWVVAGMGSKGLLYHALFAEELTFKLLETA